MKSISNRSLTFLIFSIFAIFAEVSCVSVNTSPIPKTFKASIGGGIFGPSYRVELLGSLLKYSERTEDNKISEITLTPTIKQWKEFRATLDDLKIWQWQSSYENPRVEDGTFWSLYIEYSNRTLRTHGANEYPILSGEPSGEPESTKTFNAYLAAVQKLLGSKHFE